MTASMTCTAARRGGFRVRCAAAGLALLLAACTTPYQPRGATGGYTDRKISDNSYTVAFYGNGNTSRDAVWAYWMNRCAELTLEKGFGYFTIAPKSVSWLENGRARVASLDLPAPGDAGWRWVELRGVASAPVYIYVPGGGGTITSWSSSGTVLMYRSASEPGARYALDARKVVAALEPLRKTQGRGGWMSPAELLGRTLANPDALSDLLPPWSGGGNGRVDMDELKELLPK